LLGRGRALVTGAAAAGEGEEALAVDALASVEAASCEVRADAAGLNDGVRMGREATGEA